MNQNDSFTKIKSVHTHTHSCFVNWFKWIKTIRSQSSKVYTHTVKLERRQQIHTHTHTHSCFVNWFKWISCFVNWFKLIKTIHSQSSKVYTHTHTHTHTHTVALWIGSNESKRFIQNVQKCTHRVALWIGSNESKRFVHNVQKYTNTHSCFVNWFKWIKKIRSQCSKVYISTFPSSLRAVCEAWEKTADPHTHTHTHTHTERESPWPPLSETALCLECRAQGLSQIYNREWWSVGFLSPTELITLIRLLNCMHYNPGFRGEEQASHIEQKVRWHKPSGDMHLLLHINKLVPTAVNIWMEY